MHTNYRGLTFLLSLGSLPLACAKEDKGTDDGGMTTSDTGSTGTGGAASEPTMTTTTTTADSTTADSTTAADATATETPPTGETGDETGFIPPEPTDPTCIAYGQHLVDCQPRYAPYQTRYAQQCELYKSYGLCSDGPPCQDALEAFYICLSKADCAAVDPCGPEATAYEAACPNLIGGGSED